MVKKYIRIGVIVLTSLLAVSTYIFYNRTQDLKEEISASMSNQGAFIAESSSLKEENRVFKFTIEQLNYYNDSILQKINNVRKELKIKDFNNIEVFLAVNIPAVQFDPYLEAKAYVDENNLVYENYKSLTLQITKEKYMLKELEVYAKQTNNVTHQHKVEVIALASIEEVKAYDIIKDYTKNQL